MEREQGPARCGAVEWLLSPPPQPLSTTTTTTTTADQSSFRRAYAARRAPPADRTTSSGRHHRAICPPSAPSPPRSVVTPPRIAPYPSPRCAGTRRASTLSDTPPPPPPAPAGRSLEPASAAAVDANAGKSVLSREDATGSCLFIHACALEEGCERVRDRRRRQHCSLQTPTPPEANGRRIQRRYWGRGRSEEKER